MVGALGLAPDGVCDLALKRTEYSKIYTDKGFDALIAKIDAATTRYEAGQKDD